MLGLIKAQIRIGIRKQGFQFSFLLLLIYSVATSLYYCFQQIGYNVSNLYDISFLSGLNKYSDFSWYFCRILPFIIVLPAGFSIFNDNKIRIDSVLQSKKGVKKYYISKIIVVFTLGFVVFTVPFLLEHILNYIIIPLGGGNTITNWPRYTDMYFWMGSNYLFPSIFVDSPFLYLLLSIFLTGVFGGCASVFISSFAVFKVPFKVLFFLPLYMFIYVVTILAEKIGVKSYVLDLYILAFDAVPDKNIYYYFAIMAVLMVFGCGVILIKANRDQI